MKRKKEGPNTKRRDTEESKEGKRNVKMAAKSKHQSSQVPAKVKNEENEG